MGGRRARQSPRMERDAGPRDAFHEGHRRIVVTVGIVLSLFLQDAEDSDRRLVACPPGGNRSTQDGSVRIIDGDLLLLHGDNRHHWSASNTTLRRHNPVCVSSPRAFAARKQLQKEG